MHRPSIPRTLEELVALAEKLEQRNVEFKLSVTGKSAVRKVVQAVVAMANLPGGGLVLLGVEDRTGRSIGSVPVASPASRAVIPGRKHT